jgi:hypothetical protein
MARIESVLALTVQGIERSADRIDSVDGLTLQMKEFAEELAALLANLDDADPLTDVGLIVALHKAAGALGRDNARAQDLRDLADNLVRMADSLPLQSPLIPRLEGAGVSSEPAKVALEEAAFLIFSKLLESSATEKSETAGRIASFPFATRGTCGCCDSASESIGLPDRLLALPMAAFGISLAEIGREIAKALRVLATLLRAIIAHLKKAWGGAKKLLSHPEDYLEFLCPTACGKPGLMGPLKTRIDVSQNAFGAAFTASLVVTWLFCCKKPCLVVFSEYFTKTLDDDEILLPGVFATAPQATKAAEKAKAAALAAATPKSPC